jgi:glycosyltransferase involved in cell wall biosynthesis
MTISVIVATYNRARLLDECLQHIARQRFEAGDEIIVVDNGSSDDTAAVLAAHQRTSPVPLRTLVEPAAGKSRALDRALEAARGDVLAFTDDDVNVCEGWLDAIRDAMSDGRLALVGGPVRPRWQCQPPRWLRLGGEGYGRLAAPLALLDYGPLPAPLGSRTALGANLAVRREVIERLGGFASHLGKLRGTLLSGEDHELCQRIQAAGLSTAYWPAARVSHWVPVERTHLGYLITWFFWSGITHAALERDEPPTGRAVLGIPAYLIRRFFGGIAGALGACAVGQASAARERLVDAAFAAGYAAARWQIVTAANPRLTRTA